MEVGNMLFGHSRGSYPVPREDAWLRPLLRLFEAYAPGRDNSWREFSVDFENETFVVFPYYWGECTCGFQERWDEKDAAWEGEHDHRPDCYQTELRTWMGAYDTMSGYRRIDAAAFPGGRSLLGGFITTPVETGVLGMYAAVHEPRADAEMNAWRRASERRGRFEGHVMTALCRKFKRNRRLGAAVHCTCDYRALRAAWVATDSHDRACPTVRPNFHHKPSGFEMRWYKYPLRDSYMNQQIAPGRFVEIIEDCVRSVGAP